MNWEQLIDECYTEQGCAIAQSAGSAVAGHKLVRRRDDIRRAANAVRKAYEMDPTADRETVRKQACGFVIGGVILVFLLQAFLSVGIKLAIEWFLDRIYKPKEAKNVGVSLPAE